MDQRQKSLASWATTHLKDRLQIDAEITLPLIAVSGDASFRRYFRISANGQSFICMDAPPEKEDSAPFVAIARSWYQSGVPVPEIVACDLEQGFMLLSDMGDTLYLDQLDPGSADLLYQQALQTMVKIQQCSKVEGYRLPTYDQARLITEMSLCPDWFFTQLLGLELSAAEHRMLSDAYQILVASALEQPRVCVHRDYHSRNLMLLPDQSIGVLDFQDAVLGPISYDLVSLIRDCYISWPQDKEEQWIKAYLQLAQQAQLIRDIDYPQFKRWFDWMGMQRQIKCVGIFSRLYLRDGKAGYLKDIPRTFAYLKSVCESYSEFFVLNHWLDEKVVPAMKNCHLLLAAEAGIRA